MQVLDLPCVPPFENHVIVELIPQRGSCKLRAGDMRESIEIDSMDPEANDIGQKACDQQLYPREHVHDFGSENECSSDRKKGNDQVDYSWVLVE